MVREPMQEHGRWRRAIACVLAVVVLATSGAAIAPTAANAVRAPMAVGPFGSTVVFDGHGFGHGIGLSQYGALGYALAGATWPAITNHYYGGTVAGTIDGTPYISVRLTALDGAGQTAVVSPAGALQTDALPGVTWTTIVARAIGNGQYKLWGHRTVPACPGIGESLDNPATGWEVISEVQPGPIGFLPTVDTIATNDLSSLLGVCEGTAVRSHRGEIYAATSGGALRTVNVQPVESYLRSVVGAEVPWSWGNEGGGAGMHALYAQAVAARSYALAQNRYTYNGPPNSPLKIASATCDTQACQVYRGVALRTSVAAGFSGDAIYEFPNTDWAVGFTAGQIRRWPDGRVVSTMYSSSSGGYTA